MELSEKELDISFAEGFLEEWATGQPQMVKQCVKDLVDGLRHYRKRYADTQEDLARLQGLYNALVGQTVMYLETIRQQKAEIEGLLAETQREHHVRDDSADKLE